MKKIKITWSSVIAIIITLVVGTAIYLTFEFKFADEESEPYQKAVCLLSQSATVQEMEDNITSIETFLKEHSIHSYDTDIQEARIVVNYLHSLEAEGSDRIMTELETSIKTLTKKAVFAPECPGSINVALGASKFFCSLGNVGFWWIIILSFTIILALLIYAGEFDGTIIEIPIGGMCRKKTTKN